MNWKKAVISGVVACIGLTGFSSTAFADGENLEYDFSNEQPYHHYFESIEYNRDIDIDIDVSNYEANGDYEYSVRRLDDGNNTVEQLDTLTGTADSNGEFTLSYEWTNADREHEAFPYQVYDEQADESLMRGFVARTPDSDFSQNAPELNHKRQDDVAVALGEVAWYQGDPLNDYYQHQPDNPDASTVEFGDYTFMYYETTNEGSTTLEDWEVQIASENQDAQIREIDMEVLGDFQRYADYNEPNSDGRLAMTILNTGDEVPPFIDTRYQDIYDGTQDGDNPFALDLDKGVYSYQLYNATDGRTEARGESFLMVSNGESEFTLRNTMQAITVGDTNTWEAIRETEEIANVLDLHEFLVSAEASSDYGDNFDTYERVEEIAYQISQESDLSQDIAEWTIKKSGGVDTFFYGNNADEFPFQLNASVSIEGIDDIEDRIGDWFDNIGLGDEAGKLLMVIIVTTGVAFALGMLGATMVVIGITELFIVASLIALGFIPIWIVMIIFMIAIFGVFLMMQR